MLFSPTRLTGAFVVDIEKREDERGYFARTMCRDEFAARGLESDFVQASQSFNRRKGTLRGMHFQRAPHEEVKLVRCVRGAIHDVILDLRPDSPSYLAWEAFELSAENGRMLYIPRGVAHGFQTLTDGAEVSYLISCRYAPEASTGVRYDDPAFGIAWPLPVSVVSEKDRSWPMFGRGRAA